MVYISLILIIAIFLYRFEKRVIQISFANFEEKKLNMKRFLIIVIISIAAILAFSCISCHYKMSEGGSVVPHTEVIKNQHYYDSVMDAFLNRMDGKKELSNRDIADICDFSLHNYDESLSESVGYELFHLLRNNPTNNRGFKSYLNAHQSEKCDILSALIALVSIDILENNYDSFESFVSDFPLFEDEECAAKTFAEVKENELMETNKSTD